MAGRVVTGFKTFFTALFVVGWIAVLFAMTIAQEIPIGSVEGLVVHRDKEVYKGVVAGARVILSGGEVLRRTTTDEEGRYKLSEVPVGRYWIKAKATGLVHWDMVEVKVLEGKTARAQPITMRTRPPELWTGFDRAVIVRGEKVRMNMRGYSRDAVRVRVSLHDFNARAYYLARNVNWNINPWDFADPEPMRSWDEPLKRDSEGFFDQRVNVPAEGVGAYLVRTRMGDVSRDSWFLISRLALITKQSKREFLAYSVDLKSGRPVEEAKITLFQGGRNIASGSTGPLGIYTRPFRGRPRVLAIAEKDGSLAFGHVSYYPHWRKYHCLIYTDRPVYRPDHKVYLKGILRERWDNFYRTPPATQVTVTVKEPSGRVLETLALSTNEFGTFNGAVRLSSEAALGTYRITAGVAGEDINGHFEVAEYRRPEFKASLAFDKKYFIAGTRIKGTVEASYYFGAPVAGAQVSYTVYRSPSYAFGYFDEHCCDGFYESVERERHYGYGELVLQGKGKTDASGRYRLDVPTERGKGDSFYRVEVDVTDASFRTIKASAGVNVPMGLFRLRAWTDEHIYRPGERVEVHIRAVDHEDRPRGGVQVEVRVDEQIWEEMSHRYKHVTSGEVTTRPNGEAVYRFKPDRQGYFRVSISATDRLDSLIRGRTWIWVAGDDFAIEHYRGPELEIVCDKKVYQVDETARVMINSSVKDVYALLTVEGRKLFLHKVIYLEKSNTIVDLEAREEYVPNAYISVCLVDKRKFVSREVPFNVSPEYKFLKVSVESDKEVYRPGETAEYAIKTTDMDGKPVSAEVSLGVVDESVYAIMEDRTPDIRKFFYGPTWNRVQTSYSFPDYYMGGADKEAFSGRIRKYFPDTAFWSADVVTDSEGRAAVAMKVPDSLTTWRATARAVTRDTSVGSVVQTARATKELIVRLQTPRFITQRDELSISAVLHNYTDRRQKVRLWLEVKGLDLKGDLTRSVTVKPEQIVRFEWPVTATKAGTAVLTAYAEGETDSDAVELEVPILPHGLDRISTATGAVDEVKDVKFTVPGTAIPETIRMEVRLSPTAAGAMLGSLDYLARYPYGCVEQTLSRFLPSVMVANSLQALEAFDPAMVPDLPEKVRTGLQRLYNFQNSDGGWGWWEDESSPFTTAYVVYGMTYARRAGYEVDERALSGGINSLRSQLYRVYRALQVPTPDRPPFADPTERIYMLYALSLNQQAHAKHVDDIFKIRRDLSAYGKSILGLTLYEMGEREKGDRVARELERESVRFKGMRHWDVEESKWRWQDSSIEATAYGLRALLRKDPRSPKLEEIVRWLAMKRSGNRWRSTKDTAAVVYALAEYVRASLGGEAPSYTATVHLNGAAQKEVEITGKDVLRKEIVVPLDTADSHIGDNVITIGKEGTGPLYYSAVLKYYSLEEDIKPRASGIQIRREYFRLIPTRQANGEMELKPRPINSRVKIPEEILCRLTITSNDNYHYVVIEDPRPAGWDPVEQLSSSGYYGDCDEEGGWAPWTRREVRDEKVVFFATSLPKGKTIWDYRMRAEIPGEFHSLPTAGYGMYAPQVNGHAAERRVRVR